MDKNKHISIRIHEETLEKFHFIAQYEDRSASGQIMYLINKCIREFENENGRIELSPKRQTIECDEGRNKDGADARSGTAKTNGQSQELLETNTKLVS